MKTQTHSEILDGITNKISLNEFSHISKGNSSGCNYVKLYSNDFENVTKIAKKFGKQISEERKDYGKKFGKYSFLIISVPKY